MKLSTVVFLSLFGIASSWAADSDSSSAKGKAEHVVVVVWDGMRPDFITPQFTPTLYTLATNGVFFKRHHPVYVSSTEVNGTALATGVYPNRSGVMANSDYRPEIGWLSSFGTESLDAIRRGDLLTEGNYLTAATLPEILHEAGYPTIIAGTKPVVLLHDRSYIAHKTSMAESNSVVLFKGMTIPRSALQPLIKINDDKAFPTNTTHPNTAPDAWTTKALTHGLWRKGVPKYTLLWLSEPDASQHETSPGSDISISALENSDKNLASVLKMLEEKGVRQKTDVIVVSDHGFSTIAAGRDVGEILRRNKFTANKKFENPEPGDVLVVGLGGSVSLFVLERDEEVIRRLVEFFQTSDFAGVIFSRIPLAGTFPISTVRIATTNTGPDVLVSLRWTPEKNQYGAPGMFFSEGGTRNKGSHASLSPFDMRNTLVASGPDFKKGFVNDMPSGNADVVPTLLHILGVKPPSPLDGRVLHEALVDSHVEVPKPETKTIEASHDVGLFHWRQYLKFTKVGEAIYFDEGNGEAVLR
jgi:predicted AlkP superfamily pyrophosphatase or phosphodiesterase